MGDAELVLSVPRGNLVSTNLEEEFGLCEWKAAAEGGFYGFYGASGAGGVL